AFEPWNVSIGCESDEISPEKFLHTGIDLLLDLLKNPACTIDVTAPVTARRCMKLQYSCDPQCKGSKISEKCATAGQNPIIHLYFPGIAFYNIYCLHCFFNRNPVIEEYVKCMSTPIRTHKPMTYKFFSFTLLVEMEPSDTYGLKIEADGLFGLDNLEFQCDGNQHQCVVSDCPAHHTKLGSRCSIVDDVIVQVILDCILNYKNSNADKIFKDNNYIFGT
ncbi:unnamed protein product, partial [Owenia fusiformis]